MAYALRDRHGRNYPVVMKLQIGCDPGNQVVLLDPQAAPVHATLWEQQGTLYLQDSSGGGTTFINQVPVQKIASLRIGDQVSFGSELFQVVDPNATAAVPAQASKKRTGCGRWLLIGTGLFMAECLLLAAAGFVIYSSDVEIQGSLSELKTLVSPAPSPDGPPADANLPGPVNLSLSDAWLASLSTGSYSKQDELKAEGIRPDGAAIKNSFESESMQQSNPEWLSYSLLKLSTNDQVTAKVPELRAGQVE